MTNPPILVITGIDGYFTLIFLQKSGLCTVFYNGMYFNQTSMYCVITGMCYDLTGMCCDLTGMNFIQINMIYFPHSFAATFSLV